MMQIDVNNVFNNIFRAIIFKELQEAEGPLASIVLFTKLFYGAHFFFTTSTSSMSLRGSPLLNHLQAQGKVTP